MLRTELAKKTTTTLIKIKLPQPIQIEEIKEPINIKNTIYNLVEITNFSNDSIASTPPDRYFMQNLRSRMEKN
jgi:hypothetical protein